MNKKLLTLGMAGLLSLGALGLQSVSAAGTTSTGNAKVSYTNRNSVDPSGAQWQVFIPSGISFADADIGVEKTLEAIELSGANGTDISEFHTDFIVTGTVTSTNAYKLINGTAKSNDPTYTIKYGTTVATADKTAQALPNLKKDTSMVPVKATLTSTSTVKGTYTDTLTFSFSSTVDNAITNK